MASIQITFTHPQASYSRTFDVADADLVRMVQAAKEFFYRPRQAGPGGFGGDPSPLTNQQALERLTQAFWGEMRRMTKDHELRQALIAAEATIQPIEST